MFELVLIAYLSYNNAMRAKLKGDRPFVWGFITFIAYLSAMVVGFFVVVLNFCKEINIDQLSSLDPKDRDAVSQQLVQALSANPLHMFTVELIGFGGYLLVRYIIDKKPDKKEPEVHWMDKMGQGE